jgi:hypothetical protein
MIDHYRLFISNFKHFPTLITLEARQEYLTRYILWMITACLGVFLIPILMGWLAGYFYLEAVVIVFSLLVTAIVSWHLALIGRWRWVSRIPTLMFILVGMYGSTRG